MKIPRISSYEIKISKTGHEVPVVNNIHLHSIYDPLKEADDFIKKNHKFLQNKKEILFLGLGFGYHIDSAREFLNEFHKGNYSIVIIEPNEQVTQDYISIRKIKDKNMHLYVKENIESLYFNKKLVSFLLKRPSIISHPPSFNLYKNYFKEFLTFKSPQRIGDMKRISFEKDLKKFINELDPESDIDSHIKNKLIQKKIIRNENEYLLLALYYMSKDSMTEIKK
ncbi:MAG: hypothetical protein OXB84_02050 [Halobacteriovoraceae bacterium]|nr:hypothetical protein [Halobacteriovoraceae bacterium]